MIRPVRSEDAGAIAGIYNHYIEDSVITFEEDPVSPAEMEGRIRNISSRFPYLVWEEEGNIAGYAYAGLWHERSAYRFTVTDSIYLKEEYQGKGIGDKLFSSLLDGLRAQGFHSVLALITLPNEASTGLHKKYGFQDIGCFKESGWKFGRWLDVGFWQLLL